MSASMMKHVPNLASRYTISTFKTKVKKTLLFSHSHYQHDTSFWKNTIITEFDLYCDNAYLSTIAKMTFFTGFGCGTFGAGLISDMFGRKSAIVLMSQLLFGCGILTATMPNYITFVLLWFFTGKWTKFLGTFN